MLSSDTWFAEGIENARLSLGWSFETIARKTGFGVDFLKRVHQGRPFPEVGEKITEAYKDGFAEKVADSLVKKHVLPKASKTNLERLFKTTVRRFQLCLDDTVTLSDAIYATNMTKAGSRHVFTIDDTHRWNAVLESIAAEIAEHEEERNLFPGQRALETVE